MNKLTNSYIVNWKRFLKTSLKLNFVLILKIIKKSASPIFHANC